MAYRFAHTCEALGNGRIVQVRDDQPLITWTVNDAATCMDLAAFTDSQIFEGFDPALAKRHILNT